MRDINQDGGKVLMGQDFNIFLDLENKSHRAIKANVSVSLSIQTYTGDNLATYLREEFKGIMISGNTVKPLKVNVKADKYLKHLTRDGQGDNDLDGDMEAVIVANFDDNFGDHDFVHLVEQFRVGWADLKIKAPEKVAMGAPFDVTLSFTEDVPMTLTKCKLNWEGAGFTKVENYDIPNITDAKNWSHKITVKPKKRNPDGELIVSLDCKELPDITGTLDIAVQGYVCDRLTSSLRNSTGDMGNSSYTMMSHSPEWWMIFCHRPFEPSNQRLYSMSSEMEVTGCDKDERIEREEGWRAGNRQVKVVGVDLHIKENSERHYTDKYELTQKERGRELVVRRGEPFIMTIILDSRYDNRVHSMTVNFHLGKNPDRREGTMKSLPVNESKFEPDRPYDWYVRVRNVHEKKLTLEVLSPSTCIIGEWSLSIDILVKSSRGDKPDRYHHPDDINILLNPWCIYDEVYFPETALLSEYILNDQGCVFNGSATHPSARPWNFGQFEDGILETCFRLLRKGNGYRNSNRLSNPVEIARMISHLVNLGDDGEETGILVGNWSGDYRGGTAPTQWNGSAKILKQYERNNGEPVKFGQCWVFSGVTVTICRAIGLPCKSVSCYGSAHDTDKSTTIDEYYVYQNGNYVKSPEMSSDSIWNFHVWNEIYCRRTDLHNRKYDGWQVIDSTPQELSDGMYACGPCPVKAVKNGDVVPRFDGKFIFAEVNADVIHWNVEGRKRMIDRVEKSR
ncbi:hypothetical protein FSP39_004705 [Pinctada imbricata]|uniref:Transglutaminase-like domain-containing protein n=1 Tax=Pinctada imbricata TaxID=66713 RepID=A0AA89BNI3_PINIB|nr:hypothetical protein FSP39_004705 [Pinctada imbricata]